MSDRDEWQPISTAPRDGTFVLICTPHHYPASVCAARYMTAADFVRENGGNPEDYEEGWWSDDDYTGPHEHTHWRPLPPPPKGDGE